MKKQKAHLGHIINVNVGLLGIAFCASIFYPYASIVFTFLGAKASDIAFLWLIPPAVGLVVQPIIGHLSDSTVSKYGKRRPYIFLGITAILLLSLLLPFCQSLTAAAIILGLLVSVDNIATVPMRSLVADTIPKHQMTFAFSVQAIFLGIGSIAAAATPWIFNHFLDSNTAIPYVFLPTFLALAFFCCGIVTMFSGLWTCVKVPEQNDPAKILEVKIALFRGLREIFSHFLQMPKILWQISIAQFFMWCGFFIFLAYFNLAVAELFGLPPGTDLTLEPQYKELAENATAYSSICFVFFQASCLLVSMLIPFLTKFIHRKHLMATTLFLGGAGLLILKFNPLFLLIPSAIAVGLAWGCSIPIFFAMIASNLSSEKSGLYLGIVNVAVTSAQILTGLILSPILQYLLHNHVVGVVCFSGLFFLLSALASLRIHDLEK